MIKRILVTGLIAALPILAQVKITRGTDRISVEINGKPYTEFYLSADGNKPYLYPLRTASGILVTRHFPMEEFEGETHDHPHHRGLFFSHGDVNGINFWATEASQKASNKGRMVLKKIVEAQGGKTSGTIKAIFDALDPSGKTMMTETRTIVIHADGDLRTVDYTIQIDPHEKLTFGDTKEGTFGIRLATALSEDRTGKMVNAEGKETEKHVWGKPSPWVDYYGQVDGQTVGVAILDHPSNPNHPPRWHSRAYGLFAVNPFGLAEFTNDKTQKGGMVMEPGKPVTFRYLVVIHPGDAKAANIAGLYANFTAGK